MSVPDPRAPVRTTPIEDLPVVDRAAVTRTTLVGILVLSVALVATALLDPELLGLTRTQLAVLSSIDLALTAVFASLPWRRLYERGLAPLLTGTYIVAIASLPIAAVLLGVDRPTRILWLAPLVVSISAFIARTRFHVLVTAMMLGLLVLVIDDRSVTPFDLTIRASVIVGIAVTGGVTASLWRRSVTREMAYRQEAERRSDLLTGIGEATASLSQEGRTEILRTLTATGRTMGADLVAVWLGDDLEPAALDVGGVPPRVAADLALTARSSNETLHVDDGLVHGDHAELHARTELASLVIVPILAGPARVGTLVCGARKPSAFDPEDIETLELLTRTASPGLRQDPAPADDAEVLAVLSHELRAPVTAIAGLSETIELRWDDSDDEVRRALLARVRANATALDVTLDAMRSLVQLDHDDVDLDLVTVDVGALVATTLDRLDPVLAGHPVDRRITQPALAQGAPALLERVVENLLTNARRHTPPGTRIGVSVTGVAAGIEVAVSDDGPGIDDATLERVRAPYVHGDGSTGLGLGLSLCDRILERLGSELRVESDVGRGSRFTFVLPRPDADA